MKIVSFDVGSKNLSFVILDQTKILSWNNINVQSNSNQCETLVYELDKYLEEFSECERVVIEKQPSKNNKMRIIESLLNAYFVIKGKCCTESKIQSVIVYSAKHKLNDMIKNVKDFNGREGYNNRKKLSVKIADSFIHETQQSEKIIDIFEKSKKKDDLADCLLQGLKYLDIEYINRNKSEELVKNVQSEKKIISRKPTENQLNKKCGLSKSNIKYLLQEYYKDNPSLTVLTDYIKSYKALHNSIIKQFDTIQKCIDEFKYI